MPAIPLDDGEPVVQRVGDAEHGDRRPESRPER